MASKEANGIKLQQQLKDITKCSICSETFSDPRILPCVHTFCLKCLEDFGSKSNKKSGQNMPCPLCKREFAIPLEGFTGMQKNFFMARHAGICVSISSSHRLCDACSEDCNYPASATEAPSANRPIFCTDCCKMLCKKCLNIHLKSKLTMNHKVETVENKLMSGQNQSKLLPDICQEHEDERLKIYCSDCKKVVCSFCYISSHQGHNWSDVGKASDKFCNNIQKHIENLALNNKVLQKKKMEVSQAKLNIMASMDSLQLEINQRRALLKRTIDKHADMLLMEVEALRQEKLRLVQTDEEDIELQIANEENYSLYCQAITATGSAGDICRDEAQLSKRAKDLQDMNDSICQRHLESAPAVLQISKLDEFMKENGQNLVGEIKGPTLSTDASEFKQTNEVCFAPTDTSEDLTRQALESSNTDETKKVLAKSEDTAAASKASRGEVALTKSQRITGMCIIENELFVATEKCSTVEVFNSATFVRLRCWSLSGLNNPEDMVASFNPKCLYIFDAINYGQINQVDVNGSRISSWVTGSKHVRLSVAPDSNVVVTYLGERKLKEYGPTTKDKLKQQLLLQGCSTHAIKLKTGNFLVSREKIMVFEINALGKDITFCFKGKTGSNFEKMAVDQHGSVFVLDAGNRRVLHLNSKLAFQRDWLSPMNGLQNPKAMIVDDSTSRLFVSDHDSAGNLWRILVIDIAYL